MWKTRAITILGAFGLSSCGNGDLLFTSTETQIVRTFSAGADAVQYTARVNLPVSNGTRTVVGAIGSQTAFQYFNQNISGAISSKVSSLIFPKGNYNVVPESGALYHILISGATDLTVDGQGSTLTFSGVLGGLSTGTVQGIVLSGNKRVLLKNFIIDYDVRIASRGTVQSESAHCSGVNRKYVLIDTASYPMTDTRIQQAKIFNHSNATLWGIRANEFYSYTSPVPLQDGNAFYPCSAAFDSAFATVGHAVTVRHFAYDGNAIGVYGPNSEDISFRNITLYSAPAMGIYVGNGFNRGIAIQYFSVVKNPSDSSRLVSLAADGIHFHQVARDIIVENSEVSYQGDDGLNIVSKMTNATTVSGNSIAISNAEANSFTSAVSVGDTFAFYSPAFTPLGTAILTGFSQGANTTLNFSNLSGVASGSWAIDQTISTQSVYLKNNYFHDNRMRGIMARATGMLVADNVFINTSGPAVLLMTDGADFNEGAFAKDVSVEGNTISAANRTQISSFTRPVEFGAISAGIGCSGGCSNNLAPTSLLENLAIVNNTVSTTSGLGILLSNASGASIRGNTVVDTSSTIQQSSFGGPSSAAGSIHTTRSSGVSVGSNALSRSSTSN